MNTAHLIIMTKRIRRGNPLYLLNESLVNKMLSKLEKNKEEGGRGISPRTMRNYLTTLKHFLKYLIVHDNIKIPCSRVKLNELSQIYSNLSKSYSKRCLLQILQRHQRDLASMATRKEVRKYINSEKRTQIIKLMSQIKATRGKIDFGKKQMKEFIGYAGLELSLDNELRTDEFVNMTMDEFDHGRKKKNYITVYVQRHKSSNTRGPAHLTFNKQLYEECKVYRDYMRPKVEIEGEKYPEFFLNSLGRPQASSTLNDAMNNLWSSLGFKSKVGPTMMRKTMATRFSRSSSKKQSLFASKMNHTPAVHSQVNIQRIREAINNRMVPTMRTMMCQRLKTKLPSTSLNKKRKRIICDDSSTDSEDNYIHTRRDCITHDLPSPPKQPLPSTSPIQTSLGEKRSLSPHRKLLNSLIPSLYFFL